MQMSDYCFQCNKKLIKTGAFCSMNCRDLFFINSTPV